MSSLRTEGYAIVSPDRMIADRNRHMPDGLKIPADVRFFNDGLDGAAESCADATPTNSRRFLIAVDDWWFPAV